MAFVIFLPMSYGGVRLDTATQGRIKFMIRERHKEEIPARFFQRLFTKGELNQVAAALRLALSHIVGIAQDGMIAFIPWDTGGLRIDLFNGLIYMDAAEQPASPTETPSYYARAVMGKDQAEQLATALESITP